MSVSIRDVVFDQGRVLTTLDSLAPVSESVPFEKADGVFSFTAKEKWAGAVTEKFLTVSDGVNVTLSGESELEKLFVYASFCAGERTDHVPIGECVVKNGAFEGSFTFDAAGLAIYQGAESFRITLSAGPAAGGQTCVKSLTVREASLLERTDVYNESLEGVLIKLAGKVARAAEEKDAVEQFFVSPSGKKFVQAVDENGNFFGIPTVPQKALFMGNSLLLGMGTYGMCASAPDKDYFHYVTSAILEKNPNAQFVRTPAWPFEGNEEEDGWRKAWTGESELCSGTPACELFTPDLDLIVLQLNDNINNPQRQKVFSASIDDFIKKIRETCPRARVLWVHGWYNETVTSFVASACRRWRIRDVSIADLHTKENESHRGATYVTKDGETAAVKDNWVSHPGDQGMKKIAERLIEVLNL